jgi:H+/Cl- antiporter ClcA
MSRKHKKQKTNFPWLFVAIGGVLLIIVAFFFANQDGGGGGTPVLTVDQKRCEI